MADIITFRPSPEASEILSRIKDEGGNISKHLNNLVIMNAGDSAEYTTRITLYPEINTACYDGLQEAMFAATPISMLSVRIYREFLDTAYAQGMQFHLFKLNDDLSVGFLAVSREMASMQFARYYTRDRDTKEYVRTSLPLPTIRYDHATRTIVIATRETINNTIGL